MPRELPRFALVDWLSAYERSARHPLSSSYTEPLTASELLRLAPDGARDELLGEKLHYPPHRGFPELREAIAATYDALDPAHVVAFAGADEALFVAFHALLESGDRVIVPVPCYQSLEAVPATIAAVDLVHLDPAAGFALDPDAIRRRIGPRTRLVVLSLPNNPTGTLLTRAGLDELVATCRQHGLWLLADEVYRGTERDPARRLPQLADLYERAVSVNVLSKAMGLPGLRIGWAAARDTELLDRMARMKQYLSVCNAVPAERLAIVALRARDAVLGRARGIAESNLALLDAFFRDHADRFAWRVPEAGVLGFPRWLGEGDADDLARALLERAGVLVVPGSVYRSGDGRAPARHFRIGFGRAGMAPALDAFRAFLAG